MFHKSGIPGTKLALDPLQQVDLSRAARWHPPVPSGIHFPFPFFSSAPSVAGLQHLGTPDLGVANPPGQHMSGCASPTSAE
jgi:hypothetical protein